MARVDNADGANLGGDSSDGAAKPSEEAILPVWHPFCPPSDLAQAPHEEPQKEETSLKDSSSGATAAAAGATSAIKQDNIESKKAH